MNLEARRGYIYEFDDGKNINKRYVLVVSNDTRATDKMVSVIMFGDSNLGHDVVAITHEGIGGTKYIHCGMLTYTKRDFLVREIGSITTEEMEKVETVVCGQLALRENVVVELNFYKCLYQELLNKVVAGEK